MFFHVIFALFPIFTIPRDGDNDLHFPSHRIFPNDESSPHFLALHISRSNRRFPVEHACMSRRTRARRVHGRRTSRTGLQGSLRLIQFQASWRVFQHERDLSARECQSTSIHDIYILLTTTTDGAATNLLQALLWFATSSAIDFFGRPGQARSHAPTRPSAVGRPSLGPLFASPSFRSDA